MSNYLYLASAITFSLTVSGYSQGVFNVSPHDLATEPLPLEFTVSGSIGYDDNVNPTTGDGSEDDQMYGQVSVAANFVLLNEQTRFDLSASIGEVFYFDDLDRGDDNHLSNRIGANLVHAINPRTRFVSRNFFTYGREPNYEYGFASNRSAEEYLFFSTDNAIGYEWTPRLGTYTGFRAEIYERQDGVADRRNYTLYNQFRYLASARSVLTLDYRFRYADNDYLADADNHYILAGVEYRLTENTLASARAGVQIRQANGADTQTQGTFEFGLHSSINERFKVRAVAYYGMDDYDSQIGFINYRDKTTFRITTGADYYLSRKLIFNGGVTFLYHDYKNANDGSGDVDVTQFNFYTGMTFVLTDNSSASLTYNFTNASSDVPFRDYNRNRIQLGVAYTF